MQELQFTAITGRFRARACVLAVALAAMVPARTQNAIANGDTRTISLYHAHTHESITATFRVNGSYDQSTLEKLNWFLRDWRLDEPIKMDPRLFDVVWEAYRESGSREPIMVVSAYRSPATNAMLRRRSSAVAEHSQHMLGKAMDMHYQDVHMGRVREIAMRMQRGGVGYYPTAGTPFVHLDVGSVRAWPRMTYDQLARLFPDGKTVHLPTNGQPLARYEEARAMIEQRNGVSVPTVAQVQSKGFFAALFGGGEDEPAAEAAPARGAARTQMAALGRNARVAPQAPAPAGAPAASGDETTAAAFFVAEAARRAGPAAPQPAPVAVARLETAPARQPAPVPDPRRPAQEEIQVRLGVAQSIAPLPPRRPGDLATVQVAANIPQPPVRPGDLVRVAAAEPARRPAELPSVITSGSSSPVAASSAGLGVLAFAPSAPSLSDPPKASLTRQAVIAKATTAAPVIAQPIGLRAGFVPLRRVASATFRLDRANFRALTSPEGIASLEPGALGPAAAPLRAASRGGLGAMIFAEPLDPGSRFETPAVRQFSMSAPDAPPLATGRFNTAWATAAELR